MQKLRAHGQPDSNREGDDCNDEALGLVWNFTPP
jgi:hypothetical protein